MNEYYPPDTSATAKMGAQVVAALAERHRVTVIAGMPSYDPEERYSYKLLRRHRCGNVTVERVGSTSYPRHQMRQRTTNYLTYVSLAIPRAAFLRGDLVLAMTDPPFVGIAGAIVSFLTRRPFVYNIRDLYPEMALGGNIVQPGRLPQLWEWMHRRALRRAQRVIVLGDDMRERILAKGIAPSRVVTVRDGAAPPSRVASAADPAAQQIRGGFPFVLLHAGNLGFYGAWETLIRAGRALAPEGVGLVFVGDGAKRAQVESLAEGCDGIRFLDFRPAAEIPAVMAAGDLHIVTVKRGLEGVVVPSKLYGILAAGRPVLAVAPASSDVSRLVREADCGVAVEPEDAEGIVRCVRELSGQPQRLQEMGRRARELSSRFLRAAELQHFVQVIEDAEAEHRTPQASNASASGSWSADSGNQKNG
jgi:glycosyltransferase involved in cell wall biosynthesis